MIRNVFFVATALTVAAPVFSSTIYQQNFEAGSGGFSGGSVQGTQGYASHGFGSSFWRNDGTTTLNFSVVQAQSNAKLSLSLAIIDSWDNGSFCCGPDKFRITLDGSTTPLFNQIFDNYLGAGASTGAGLTTLAYNQALGFTSSFRDAAYTLALSLGNLSAGSHTLTFSAYGPGWQGGGDESYGLDNVSISSSVAEPGSLALAALGLAGVLGRRRQRAAATAAPSSITASA